MSEPAFVVRTLPATSLKGAFRVHMSPEALTQLQLKVGDLCNIIGEDGTRGAGIAWRALDKMGSAPKSQSAKMTEILREAFGFKQGTQVRIEKAAQSDIPLAKRITLTEVSPIDNEGPTDGLERWHCISVFHTCEAIAVGTTIDVSVGERHKKRYFVESIESEPVQNQPTLYRFNDRTDIKILDSPPPSPISHQSVKSSQIDANKIGGLQTQVNELNERLRALCLDAELLHRRARIAPPTEPLLLHGFSGTGKTMLLRALSKVSKVNKTISIDTDQLLATPSKGKTLLTAAFDAALASQPSLILIDDVDKLATAGDAATSGLAKALDNAFATIEDSQVLVVGAAQSITALNPILLKDNRFTEHIELPIPNAGARASILAIRSPDLHPELVKVVAARTHGFTGDDLGILVKKAYYLAFRRFATESEGFELTVPPSRISTESLNGRSESVASTLVERPPSPVFEISLADFEVALTIVKPSALREIIVEPPKMTFDDIGGSADMKSRFDSIIQWPVDYAAQYAQLPAKKPKKGILLYGPPGCSKTMTAQAVASTYGWNFVAVKGAELISMYVGESERAVREIFRKARQAAPTIIFFDEIDSIATARSGATDASRSLNVVTTLLNEMDGFAETKNVLVLAATNQPASLDPAILRPGRFDEHVYVGPPNAAARLDILKIYTRGVPGRDNLYLDEMVTSTEGMSGAEIQQVCSISQDIALDRAIKEDKPVLVTNDDLLNAIAKTSRGITQSMLQTYEEFAKKGDKTASS